MKSIMAKEHRILDAYFLKSFLPLTVYRYETYMLVFGLKGKRYNSGVYSRKKLPRSFEAAGSFNWFQIFYLTPLTFCYAITNSLTTIINYFSVRWDAFATEDTIKKTGDVEMSFC